MAYAILELNLKYCQDRLDFARNLEVGLSMVAECRLQKQPWQEGRDKKARSFVELLEKRPL